MLENYSPEAQQSVAAAQESARMLGHDRVGTEHLLIGLLREGGSPASTALVHLGITDPEMAGALEGTLGVSDPKETPPPFDIEARAVIDAATKEASFMGRSSVGPEVLLLAAIEPPGSGAGAILRRLNVDPAAVRPVVAALSLAKRQAEAVSGTTPEPTDVAEWSAAPGGFTPPPSAASAATPATATPSPRAPMPPKQPPAPPSQPTQPPPPPPQPAPAAAAPPATPAPDPTEPPKVAAPEAEPEKDPEAASIRSGAGKEIGQILVEQGAITRSQLEEALEGAQDKLLGRALIDLGVITDSDLVGALSIQIGLEFVNLDTFPIQDWAASLIPEATAWRHHVIPIGERDGALLVAMSNPRDEKAIEEVRSITKRDVQPVVAMASGIERALRNRMSAQATPGRKEDAAAGPSVAASPDSDDRLGPPDRTIGTAMGFTRVLAITRSGVFVALTDIVAYPSGMRVIVTLRRPESTKPEKWFAADGWQSRWQSTGAGTAAPKMFRVGVEFPDGSRVDSSAQRSVPSQRGIAPSFVPMGAEVSPGRVDLQFWVWPLPREGEAIFFCEWPSEGVELVGTTIDCALVAEAADRAHILWGSE